jgi:hypothetical protein
MVRYSYDNRQGWRRATKPLATKAEAVAAMAAMPGYPVERRIYETVMHKGGLV